MKVSPYFLRIDPTGYLAIRHDPSINQELYHTTYNIPVYTEFVSCVCNIKFKLYVYLIVAYTKMDRMIGSADTKVLDELY